jgi:alpha-L-fucosidase
MQDRLLELMAKYPDVLLFWLDGYVMINNGFKRLNYTPMYQKLHEAKLNILIGCNSGTTKHEYTSPASDFLLFENLAGRHEMNPVVWPRHDPSQLPAEACLTVNEHWGWNAVDKDYKDPYAIARLVLENCKRRGNTLLNFGPMPNGYISEEQVVIAETIGNALKSE